MGELVMTIGGIVILFVALDLFGFEGKGWKKMALQVGGGFAAVAVGALMKYFGI